MANIFNLQHWQRKNGKEEENDEEKKNHDIFMHQTGRMHQRIPVGV